ncbi:MAG: hypothetical protein LBN38_03305 [Verrucomicrobiota bacterium]|nr:hypothetical protein [Verrucomicrobiota bacterium]
MNAQWFVVSLPLFLALALPTSAQRVEFQRKKFDRSRFDRPGSTVPQAPVQPAPSSFPPPAASVAVEEEAFKPPVPTGSTPAGSYSAEGSQPRTSFSKEDRARLTALIETPLLDEVPSKWFTNAKDYPELVELQNRTGACMLIYFKNPSQSNEKGLCNWFEKEIGADIKWRKAMKYFIKLQIQLPGNSATRELQAKFNVKSTPALYVIKPNSMPTRLPVIQWQEGRRPEPYETEEVLEYLRTRSPVAYQALF